MAEKSPLITIDPDSELRFIGPFTNTVNVSLTLTNVSSENVFFKIKTTAPRSYCVRPNNGLIASKNSSTVQVMLQPFEYDSKDKSHTKHKFMVQSKPAPEGATIQDSEAAFKANDPEGSLVYDNRLKCVFEMPDGDSFQATNTKPEINTEHQPPLGGSDSFNMNPTGSGDFGDKDIPIREYQAAAPVISPETNTEIETLRKRNVALNKELIELKTQNRGVSVKKTNSGQLSSISIFHILIALMILVVGWIIGRSI